MISVQPYVHVLKMMPCITLWITSVCLQAEGEEGLGVDGGPENSDLWPVGSDPRKKPRLQARHGVHLLPQTKPTQARTQVGQEFIRSYLLSEMYLLYFQTFLAVHLSMCSHVCLETSLNESLCSQGDSGKAHLPSLWWADILTAQSLNSVALQSHSPPAGGVSVGRWPEAELRCCNGGAC